MDLQPLVTDSLSGLALTVSTVALWRTERTTKCREMRQFLEESENVIQALHGLINTIESEPRRRYMESHADLRSEFMASLRRNIADLVRIGAQAQRWHDKLFYPALDKVQRVYAEVAKSLELSGPSNPPEAQMLEGLAGVKVATEEYIVAARQALRKL